jgi:signal transduction histidine kinase
MLDIRTVFVSGLLISLTIVVILALFWQSLHQRFAGMTFWLASFSLQAIGLVFILLRDVAPDWLSVILGNLCVVAAMSLVSSGLMLFIDQPAQNRWLWPAGALYAGLMVIFTYFQPHVVLRVVCTSAMILLSMGRCGWMLIVHAPKYLQAITRGAGIVLLAIALLHACRIVGAVTLPAPSDLMGANLFDVLVLMFNQVLLIALAFAIMLMTNGRLIIESKQHENQLEEQAQLLRQRESQIKEYADTLEMQVAQRTKQLEETQVQLIQQEKLAVLGKLANVVGHELRNPLGNIHNAVYLLNLVQPEADAQIKEYLELIKHEARAADRIVVDLLDFARVKSCNPELVAIAELTQRTLEQYPPPNGVRISQVFAPDLPPAYVDPHHIIKVLCILAVNAYQALPNGGELIFRGQTVMRETHEMVAIEVEDNGKGILPENMPHIFEPLFTTKAKGVGLGLAVAQKLVQANGGTIEARSEPGAGSTFTVYLPIHGVNHD